MQNKEKFNYDILDKVANSGRRPDLLENAVLSKKEKAFLEELVEKSGKEGETS